MLSASYHGKLFRDTVASGSSRSKCAIQLNKRHLSGFALINWFAIVSWFQSDGIRMAVPTRACIALALLDRLRHFVLFLKAFKSIQKKTFRSEARTKAEFVQSSGEGNSIENFSEISSL